MRHQRGFEEDQLFELDALAQRRDVIDNRCRKLFRPQPHANEGMTLKEDDQRVEVRLLQAGGKQERKIHAGGQARLGHLAGPANLLPSVLEARWRQGIVQPHGDHRAPDCRRKFPGPLGAMLVTIDGRALADLVKHTRS